MRIDGIGSNASAAVKALKHPKPVGEEIPNETAAPAEAVETDSEAKSRGVLRLLAAGHFKGVADVRLRINFHEELAAMESRHLKATAAADFDRLNQTVKDQIAALKDSGLLDADQTVAVEEFLTNLQDAQDGFLNGQGISVQELIDSFQAKLNDLMALLDPPAPAEAEAPVEPVAVPEEPVESAEPQPPAAEEPAVGVEGAQPPAEEALMPEPAETIVLQPQPAEPSPLQLLVTHFQESIQQAIDELQSGLTGTSALPPLSEPSGKGAAYAKFVAIYESMQAGEPVDDTPAEPQQIDAVEPTAAEPVPDAVSITLPL